MHAKSVNFLLKSSRVDTIKLIWETKYIHLKIRLIGRTQNNDRTSAGTLD